MQFGKFGRIKIEKNEVSFLDHHDYEDNMKSGQIFLKSSLNISRNFIQFDQKDQETNIKATKKIKIK